MAVAPICSGVRYDVPTMAKHCDHIQISSCCRNLLWSSQFMHQVTIQAYPFYRCRRRNGTAEAYSQSTAILSTRGFLSTTDFP